MNSVVLAVIVMLVLSIARVHVILALIIGALVGGLASGLSLSDTLGAMSNGLGNGAETALSYALLGAFAMGIAHSGLPEFITSKVIESTRRNPKSTTIKWAVIFVLFLLGCFSQNLIPIHIAFIPIVVPPLIIIFNTFKMDRRMIACALSFGMVACYMAFPYGFGDIFLNKIIIPNVNNAGKPYGLDVSNVNIIGSMIIPFIGMFIGLLIAIFISYRKPREYRTIESVADTSLETTDQPQYSTFRNLVALGSIVVAFVVQLATGSLLMGAMLGFALFLVTGVIKWKSADGIFTEGLKMMCMIGFIMITAQGFASVMNATKEIEPLVRSSIEIFGGSKMMASFAMLAVGLLVTMGIGSSFSTIPIITTIFVPICANLGFSPEATIALIATAGALGDTGSPASDQTLGPSSGLNVDGQHDHIKDTVIPTFVHFNIPLLLAGVVATMVL